MSLDNAKSFLKQVEADKALQGKIKDAGDNAEATLKIAAANGLNFTADELQAAQDQLWGNLSDGDLKNVAGGRFYF